MTPSLNDLKIPDHKHHLLFQLLGKAFQDVADMHAHSTSSRPMTCYPCRVEKKKENATTATCAKLDDVQLQSNVSECGARVQGLTILCSHVSECGARVQGVDYTMQPCVRVLGQSVGVDYTMQPCV